MKGDITVLFTFAAIALALLVADRFFRIRRLTAEGFLAGRPAINAAQCGVDFPPCPFPFKCANGYCIDPDAGVLVERAPIPVVP